jgi:hypothetical protein
LTGTRKRLASRLLTQTVPFPIANLSSHSTADLAGKPSHEDPNKVIRPEGQTLATLVNAAIRLSRHEAIVYGLDAPSKAKVLNSGQPIDDDAEVDVRLARLTPGERDTFMMLIAKMDGRWVEPPAIK